jgi:hypothetical protein
MKWRSGVVTLREVKPEKPSAVIKWRRINTFIYYDFRCNYKK